MIDNARPTPMQYITKRPARRYPDAPGTAHPSASPKRANTDLRDAEETHRKGRHVWVGQHEQPVGKCATGEDGNCPPTAFGSSEPCEQGSQSHEELRGQRKFPGQRLRHTRRAQ